MAAPGITVLKHNVPWGPFTRAQIDEGMARGDFTVEFLAHAPGLAEWLPLGEVLDYIDRHTGPRPFSLPPVPGLRELPPIPETTTPKPAPPSLPEIHPATGKPAPRVNESSETIPAPPLEVELHPASFFARGFAFVIDCAILFVPVIVLFALGFFSIEVPRLWDHTDSETINQEWALLQRNTRDLAWIVAVGFGWIYGAGLESSRSQATIGKRWMGIKVTDAHGQRISFLRATGRYAAKYLSALPCFLGFMAALVSSRRLALHDRLADTRVVRD